MSKNWETIIGLEVHAQLATQSKIWCSCSTEFGTTPNSQTCPSCLGMPGTLPVLNTEVVKMAIKAGLAVDCTINERSVFARKNYFYPDLPKGYQISQGDQPLCSNGRLEFGPPDKPRSAGITRIHLEEDAAKNLHGYAEGITVVDYNRGGTPLIEIVGEPDLRSAEDAAEYLKVLRSILMHLGVNDGNMEEGNFRCDANVSVRKVGEEGLRTRVELKNINSFRFVRQAIDYEVQRQIELYESGGKVEAETRNFDPQKGITRSLRSKDEATDYRYFPDPDLQPLELSREEIEKIRSELPELPRAKAARFVADHGLSPADAETIAEDQALAVFFEECLKAYPDGRKLSIWFVGELSRVLNEKLTTLNTLRFGPSELAELLTLVDDKTISITAAKEVFALLVEGGGTPKQIVEKKGLAQVSDTGAIEAVVDKIMAANPDEVEKYRSGKKNVIGFFVGQVMREMRGKGNPALVNQVLREKLEG